MLVRWHRGIPTLVVAFGLAGGFAGVAWGGNDATKIGSGEGETNTAARALLKLSVEDLMNITVTSVSKKAEKLSTTPAAIAVISQDDIRHAGVTTIPDALRLVPGVQVGRVDSHQWAVGVRGFNDTISQKLLVLMDGRSVYTPLFSGVLWQSQDTMLEDLDRIEVIRGPGGTVWGANAVNGVISMVSKPAKETQGLLVSGGGGSSQQALTAARYGGRLDDHTFYRVYGKYAIWDDFPLVGGGRNNDGWWRAQSGFRLDHEASDANLFTLQGDYYASIADGSAPLIQPVPPSNNSLDTQWEQQGGNLLGRWTHTISAESEFSLQAYYDYTDWNYAQLQHQLHTIDLDSRYRFQLGARQEIVCGGGYRVNAAHTTPSAVASFNEQRRSDQLFNVFVQDEITLVPERLRFTMGSKVEHNDFTGFEYEPSGRLSWTPHDRHTFWASVSRAVRTPSQFESDARVNLSALPANPPFNPLPTLVVVAGSPAFESETLVAYELGYRVQPHENLSFDLTGFLNSYDNLRGTSERTDFSTAPSGYVTVVSDLVNNRSGDIYGGELAVTWQLADWWRLYGSYTLTKTDLKAPPNALTGAPTSFDESSPQHQFSLRSSMALGRDVDLDASFRWVDHIVSSGAQNPGLVQPSSTIPSYATVDVRLAWRPVRNLEFSIVGQNLFEPRHREFNPTFISTKYAEVPRSVFGKLTWSF